MKKHSLNTQLYLTYLACFIPLLIYGFYKNGIRLYYTDIIGPIEMFRPLFILIFGITGAILGVIVREHRNIKNKNFNLLNKCKECVVEATLTVAILPLMTNPLIVFAINFLFSLVLSKVKINRMCIMYLIIEGINVLIGSNDFSNPYELSTVLNYDAIDIFLGKGLGGIFSTSIIFIIVALILLSFNKLYKKEMVYSSLIVFLLAGSIPFMLKGDYGSILPFLFGHNVLFILVFISPCIYSSCYTVKGQILSGIIIGIMTYALSYITPYTACILSVLIVSLIKNVLDRIFVIK